MVYILIILRRAREARTYEVEFAGSKLTSGIYYYKLKTEKFSEIKKMILVK